MDAARNRGDPAWMSCRVLIVEDDDAFAEIIRVLLEADGGFELVGRARDGVQAVELARALVPDVITMDIDMPRMDGAEATGAIHAADPTPRIVIVSGSDSGSQIEAARSAGAHGYVAKARVPHDLCDVLHAACAGDAFVTAA
jgi:DNA-binding NarL/FixJ family response regulator